MENRSFDTVDLHIHSISYAQELKASPKVARAKRPLPDITAADTCDRSYLVESCCKNLQAEWQNEKWMKSAWNLDQDPYFTGPGFDKKNSFGFGYTGKSLLNYEYIPSQFVGNSSIIPESFYLRIPPILPREKIEDYDLQRLTELGVPANSVTFAGAGTLSRVYYLHNKIPSDEELRARYPDERSLLLKWSGGDPKLARRKIWAKENAKVVIKLRVPHPQGKSSEEAARYLRRDLIVQGLLKELAKNFKKVDSDGNKTPFIQVSSFKFTPDELSKGILRQDAQKGDSAFFIFQRIQRASEGDREQERYLIDVLKFEDLEEAKKEISLLEQFFRLTRQVISDFSRAYSLLTTVGRSLAGKPVEEMGADYGKGANVFRDPVTRTWVLIDQ